MSSPGCTWYVAPLGVVTRWYGTSRLAVVALAAPSDAGDVPSCPARPASVVTPSGSGSCGGTTNTAAFGSARLSVTSAVLWNARSGIVEALSASGNAVTSRLTVAVGAVPKIPAGRPGPLAPTR